MGYTLGYPSKELEMEIKCGNIKGMEAEDKKKKLRRGRAGPPQIQRVWTAYMPGVFPTTSEQSLSKDQLDTLQLAQGPRDLA